MGLSRSLTQEGAGWKPAPQCAGWKPAPQRPTPRRRLALASLAVLLLASCYEEPVEEALHLCFLDGGTLVVTAITRVNVETGGGSNPALARRLADIRRSLERGDDNWRRRFDALEPLAERLVLDKEAGEVRELRRSAAGVEPEGLRRLFADAGISALLDVREGRAELTIATGPSNRAGREQRKQVDAALAAWTELLARYAGHTIALYRYLEERPDRAAACFSNLFQELTRKQSEELGDREDELVGAIKKDIDEAVTIFAVPDGEVYTMNELSHLVYDPFPARLVVRVSGAVVESEGFETVRDGTLVVAGLGLWEALEALEGRWLAPDPLLVIVREQRARNRSFDVDAMTALPRRTSEPPAAAAVRDELERWLEPAPIYRAVWQVPPPPDDDDGSAFSWNAVQCP